MKLVAIHFNKQKPLTLRQGQRLLSPHGPFCFGPKEGLFSSFMDFGHNTFGIGLDCCIYGFQRFYFIMDLYFSRLRQIGLTDQPGGGPPCDPPGRHDGCPTSFGADSPDWM